jgi:hypothetical protein
MDVFKWIVILILIEVSTIFIFAAIYNALNTEEVRDYMDGLYISVQIQTSIGMSENIRTKPLKVWISIQSVLSDILNVLLIVFVGIFIGSKFIPVKI